MKLTIIGIVDNSDSAHFGLYIPHSRYSTAALGEGGDAASTATPGGGGGDPVTVATLGAGGDAITSADQSYYFRVAPGQDKRALALKLGSSISRLWPGDNCVGGRYLASTRTSYLSK